MSARCRIGTSESAQNQCNQPHCGVYWVELSVSQAHQMRIIGADLLVAPYQIDPLRPDVMDAVRKLSLTEPIAQTIYCFRSDSGATTFPLQVIISSFLPRINYILIGFIFLISLSSSD